MSQLVEGVRFMHQHKVAHLDLKPDNVLVRRGQLRIIDFGVSVRVSGADTMIKGFRGTPTWAAPEVGDPDGPDQRYSPIRADLWSCGRLLQYLANHLRSKNHPFGRWAKLLLDPNPLRRPLLTADGFQSIPIERKRRITGFDTCEQHKRVCTGCS
jgi:serine/threonine protein kinase